MCNLSAITGMTVLLSVFFAYLNGLRLDGAVAYLCVDAVFLAVLIYLLENNRIHQKIGHNVSNHYSRITECFCILCLLTALCRFLPAFVCPAAFFSLFLGVVSNAETATGLVSLLIVNLCMASGGNFYELASCLILTITGAQMSKTMREKKYRPWGCMILLAVSVSVPMLFYYLFCSESRLQLLYLNLAVGAAGVVFFRFLAARLYDKTEFEAIDAMEKIVAEDYPMVNEIKNYSRAEYVHAMKVSTIAGKCAAEIGANELVAAAAGFYYRIGILEGEPFVENGIRLAEEKCFPEPIIRILSEYNGELQLPSSRESAIVHMADACLKKVEMLSGHNLSTSWNQDMVIYQTLNELSASGIYDESGLSMNQFLKLRELLVREEIGYDNTD